MSNPPATLPANFFESPAAAPQAAAGPPKTLPANFFEQGQPAPAQSVPGAPNGLPGMPAPANPITQNEELEAGQHRGKAGTIPGLHSNAAATGTLGEYSEAASQPMTAVMGEGLVEGIAGKVSKAIPSAERAGKVMQGLREAVGTHPVEITENLSKATMRAQELADNGNTLPTAVRKFINRVTDPEKGHLTYNEARDYLTKLGNMTAEEATKMAPAMKSQVQKVATSLREAISETAGRAGKLEEFQGSMKEYSSAKKLEEATEFIKEYAKRAAIGGAVGSGAAAAYEGLKKLLE